MGDFVYRRPHFYGGARPLSVVLRPLPLTPIARWNFVPYQRIIAPIKIGVVTFSKAGIASVQFTWTGAATGAVLPATVTSIAYNSDSDTWEWFAELDPADFNAGEVVTLGVVVTGDDSGVNNDAAGGGVQDITIVANNGGGYRQCKAWVDSSSGDDGTGVASPTETGSNPFLHLADAALAIQTYNNGQGWGNNADGGIIYCEAGTYDWAHDGNFGTVNGANEYMTVTAAAGEGPSTVTIQKGGAGYMYWDLVRVHNVRLYRATASSSALLRGTSSIACFVDQCSAVSDGGPVDGASLTSSTSNFTNSYVTGGSADGFSRAYDEAAIVRDVHVIYDYGTVLRHVLLSCNVTIDEIDPTAAGSVAGFHADTHAIQGSGNLYDRIAYNVQCKSAHYAGPVVYPADDADVRGVWVNFYVRMEDPINRDGGFGGFLFKFNPSGTNDYTLHHFLIWNCTFYDNTAANEANSCNMFGTAATFNDLDIKGLVYDAQSGTSKPTLVSFVGDEINVKTTGTGLIEVNSTNVTTGDPGLGSTGAPLAGSTCIDRMTRLSQVPVDVNNDVRGAITAIGAFRGPNEAVGGLPAGTLALIGCGV